MILNIRLILARTKQSVVFLSPLLFLLILFTSCTSNRKPAPVPTWSFEQKAIEIHYRADKKLNLYDGKPHTILMCIFQLSNPNVFKELSKSEDGLNRLLQCSRFDESVVDFMRVFVQPGESKSLYLDRAENAKWVGLVAGYYELATDLVAQLYEIPVIIKKKGLIFRKRIAKVGTLSINIFLGPNEIRKAGSK